MALTYTLVNTLLSQDAQTSKVVDLLIVCIFDDRTLLNIYEVPVREYETVGLCIVSGIKQTMGNLLKS